MINFHLNGDIIRCPDVAEVHRRALEIRERHHICKYGYSEFECDTWLKYCREQKTIKKISDFGACHLCTSENCPGHKLRVALGNTEKKFRIDNVNYRKLSSAAHYLVKKSKNKTLFITLTFPKFKTKYNEKQLNECFSRFVENLRQNYNCGGYCAVRERGKVRGRYHFHLLLSIPFVPFVILNSAWLHAISDICEPARNALQTDKKTLFIRRPGRALRYVCKYFAKSKGAVSKTRILFISNDLIREPRHFDNKNTEYYNFNDLINDFKSIKATKINDYVTAFRVCDAKEFDKLCERVLYKLFNLSENSSELYSFHPG